MAAQGVGLSGGAIEETIRLRTEYTCGLLQARFDAFIEGSELHGLPLDVAVGSAILEDLELARSHMVAGALSSMPTELLGAQCRLISPEVMGSMIQQKLESATGNVMAQFRLQLRREALKTQWPQASQQPSITNIYHLSGYNPRVNVNSIDSSTKVTILPLSKSSRSWRSVLSQKFWKDNDGAKLAGLAELKKAQNSPTFVQRYLDFIAVAADHMSIIAPLIPPPYGAAQESGRLTGESVAQAAPRDR
jgi:hypothetical protein